MKIDRITMFKTVFILSLFITATLPAREIILNCPTKENTITYLRLKTYYDELGEKAGIRFQLNFIPPNRGMRVLKNGLSDGDSARIKEAYEETPWIIRLTEAIVTVPVVCITTKEDFVLRGPDSLRGYRLGTPLGTIAIKRYCEQNNLETSEVLFREQGITMLLNGRLDFFLVTKVTVDPLEEPEKKRLRVLSPPLFNMDVYLHLHEKHKDLIPLLTPLIKEMRESGRSEEIFNMSIGDFQIPTSR